MRTNAQREKDRKRMKLIGYVLLAMVALILLVALSTCTGSDNSGGEEAIGGDSAAVGVIRKPD